MVLGRLSAALVGIALLATPAAAAGTIGMEEVQSGLASGRIVLIDVREAGEFAAGHVPGAVNMPLSSFSPAALPKPVDKTVVLMCRSGNRSGRAQAAAIGAGRDDVVNYSGSMLEWSARGGPIAR